MDKLDTIVKGIYQEIRDRNYEERADSVPLSDDLYTFITQKYNVAAFSVPKLINVLVDSHMIFPMDVVNEDRKNKILKVNGFVVTEGNILAKLRKVYEDELIELYSHEFHKKTTIEKIIKDLVPKLDEFNNTPVGRVARIILSLEHCSSTLERKIMDYSKKKQESLYEEALSKIDENSIFLKNEETKKTDAGKENSGKQRRATDSQKYQEFQQYSNKHSIEKTLALYGVDFYTRVCFRDYNFSYIEKLIRDDLITNKRDLMTIKRYLQKERSNSDQDLKLQEFANQINSLEKTINNSLQKHEK